MERINIRMALLVATLLLALTARGQNDDAAADDYFPPRHH